MPIEQAVIAMPGGAPAEARPLADRSGFDWAGRRVALAGRRLGVPVRGTVYGALLNYRGALAALGASVDQPPYKAPPRAPVLYIKPRNTLIGHGAPIPVPADAPELEMGAALAVVIGRAATRVPRERALAHVAGYTVANDVTVPHASYYRPSVRLRCRDGFCPIGPWVIGRDHVNDPDRLALRVFIDGALRQQASTSDLVRPVAALIADVTAFMTLAAGDVLLVGVPAGAPRARAGQTVTVEIDGIGRLDNRLVGEDDLVLGESA